MGLFSYIETFFFISLAITFVLILLLVYHFKQRIITVEQKCDTMFDIINTMVQEIQYLRAAQTTFRPPAFQLGQFQSPLPVAQQYKNLVVSEEDEGSGSDSESDDSSDVGVSDSDSESDNESESEPEVKKIVLLDTIETIPSALDNEYTDGTIKLVSMENELHLDELPMEQEDLESVEPELENDVQELDNTEQHVVVEKIDTIETLDVPQNEDAGEDKEQNAVKEVYAKMSTASLKQLVVQKGLCSDASKIRRPELLKLLESA
jgi:hypothetical protein